MTFILRRIHNNFVLEVNTTIFASYLIFFVAESTPVHVSGILAIVALGLFMTRTGKTRISAASEHAVHHVWGYIGFVAETIIFIMSGLVMGKRAVSDNNIGAMDYVKLVVGTYPILHVIRFGIILLFWPLLQRIGYGLTFNQLVLCAYAGLRGAVGLSLALMVTSNPKIPKYIQDVILLHVAGIALLTLLINATTTGWLVRKLGLSKQSDLQKNIMVGLTYKLDGNIDQNIEVLKTKKHFNHVDWKDVKSVVQMNEIKERFRKYRELHLDGDQEKIDLYNPLNLKEINEKYEQHVQALPDLSGIKNLDKMHSGETFKGLKKQAEAGRA